MWQLPAPHPRLQLVTAPNQPACALEGVCESVGFENFSYRAPTKCVVFGVELATPSRAWLPMAAGFSRASQGHSHIPQSPGRDWEEGSEG